MRIMAIFFMMLVSWSAFAGTFKDDFNDGNFDGWKILDLGNGAEWKVEDGILVGKTASDWSTALYYGKNEWKNYSIECDMNMVQIFAFSAMGLGLRLSLDNNGSWIGDVWAAASITNANAYIQVWLNWNSKDGSFAQFNPQLNKWYHFRGVAKDEKFELYIDDELVANLTNTLIPTGYVSLSVNGSLVQFDNVVITSDDILGNSQAVSSKGKLATSWGEIKSR